MRIGVLGGTGKLGTGLALRWARAGHPILVGSRDPAKARGAAADVARAAGGSIEGGDNEWVARSAEVLVLTVPYAAHAETLRGVAIAARGKVVVDATVPLRPPRVSVVHVPPGGAAALEAQAILGAEAPVAAAFHHLSASHLGDPAHVLEGDVLVAADDRRAREQAIDLASFLGLRGLDAGPLANAVALESMTPVLIHLNRTYKSTGAGVAITNLARPSGG
jgi:8-hydroxy-5-deazaflavin:NADPH oxidoreductase